MKPRVSEREVVCALLKTLDLPFLHLSTHPKDVIVRLFLSDQEWNDVRAGVSTMRLDEVVEGWRELPPSIWTDETWVNRVCIRVCSWASDYRKLILAKTGS